MPSVKKGFHVFPATRRRLLDKVHYDYFKNSSKQQLNSITYLTVQTKVLETEADVMLLKKQKLEAENDILKVNCNISLLQR